MIRREVLISLTQLMEILQHVSVTLNSVRKIKTETLRVSIMRTSKEKEILVLCNTHLEDYVFLSPF